MAEAEARPVNVPKLNIGKLRHRIRILQRVNGRDAQGGIDPQWLVFADRVPAAIEPARAIQSFGGAQLQENFDTLIRVRWMPGLRTSMRVEWDQGIEGSPESYKSYEITGVRTRDEVRNEVFLQCIERQAEGWRKQ